MGDSQDRQDAAEEAFVSATGPSEEPADDALASDTENPAHEDVLPDDVGGDVGLTGVLAALEEPEPEVAPAEGEAAIVDSEPVDSEIAALQADLEADDGADMTAASESEAEAEAGESLGEIAPGKVGGVQEASEDAKDIALPDDRPGVPLWPFLAYFVLWVVFAGLLVWQFSQVPVGTPVYELEIYGPSILAGLVLTALGPLLAFAVWLTVWLTRPGARAGLFSRSLIIGAVTTLAGVALWLIALGAVDMLRLGRLL